MASVGRLGWVASAVCALCLLALAHAAPASANLDTLLSTCAAKDALDGTTVGGSTLPYTFCDDGVPAASGGRTPNPTAQSAIKVPSAYMDGAGLPATDTSVAVPGEDLADTVALDVDVSLPDPAKYPVTDAKYPVVVMMHGCCSGNKTSWEGDKVDPGGAENWHYNNAWFASRGYIVVTYTARGFVDKDEHGSTGETQLDSAKYEINDYQSLVAQLADKGDLDPGAGTVKVDPQRIVPTGGSYGGGFAWLALTDPTWKSAANSNLKVVAAATKYGWTNLVESLVPRGDDTRDSLPETDPTVVKKRLKTEPGFPKRSINAALYGSGKGVLPPGRSHTTFPMAIDQAQVCLTSFDPFESNPLCTSTLDTELGRFIDERSAYFQSSFFDGLKAGTIAPVPVFSAGTLTDKLFPAAEHRRMVERLKQSSPNYPVQEYYGDYNHFVQTKRKEFADVCGADHHVCAYADYPVGDLNIRDLNKDPPSRSREPGVTSRLNRFIDHYAKPPANTDEDTPAFDVTGALQVCPQNAAFLGVPSNEPGPRFTAGSFAALAPGRLDVHATGTQVTTNDAGANPHAKNDDPVGNLATNGGKCPVESSPGGANTAGPGVAVYDSEVLPADATMLGITRAVVQHTGIGSGLQLNARLYDLYPNGDQVLVDRGFKRLANAMGPTTMDLNGAGWRFAKGHKVRIELAQDDDPYIKSSVQPGSLTITQVDLSIPTRETLSSPGGGSGSSGGGSGSSPGGGSGSAPQGGAPGPLSASPPAGPPGAPSVRSRRLAVGFGKVKGGKRIRVRHGRFKIRCRAHGTAKRTCRVTVKQIRSGHKPRTIGSGRAAIARGRRSAIVTVRLSRTGRRALAASRRRGIAVRLDLRVTESGTARVGTAARRYRLTR